MVITLINQSTELYSYLEYLSSVVVSYCQCWVPRTCNGLCYIFFWMFSNFVLVKL
jgi:hypothetical protein